MKRKQTKARKSGAARRAVQAAGLPEDILLGMPRVLLRGDSSLFLENHLGIVEYAPERIRIRTQLGVVTVEGEGIALSQLGESDVLLSGAIEQISFAKGGGGSRYGMDGKGRPV